MWGMLGDLAKQLMWPVNGSMVYMAEDDWKDVMTAGLRRHNRIAAGIDGGAVILGMRTRKMSKEEMTDLIYLMLAFGANREPQIVWTHEVKRLRELEAMRATDRQMTKPLPPPPPPPPPPPTPPPPRSVKGEVPQTRRLIEADPDKYLALMKRMAERKEKP